MRISKSEAQGGKLLIQGEAPSEQAKNKVWDEVKKIDPAFRTYTVKTGDTLSKIAKDHYGDAKDYRRIFDANRDKLKDPDKIQPGQVLTIP